MGQAKHRTLHSIAERELVICLDCGFIQTNDGPPVDRWWADFRVRSCHRCDSTFARYMRQASAASAA